MRSAPGCCASPARSSCGLLRPFGDPGAAGGVDAWSSRWRPSRWPGGARHRWPCSPWCSGRWRVGVASATLDQGEGPLSVFLAVLLAVFSFGAYARQRRQIVTGVAVLSAGFAAEVAPRPPHRRRNRLRVLGGGRHLLGVGPPVRSTTAASRPARTTRRAAGTGPRGERPRPPSPTSGLASPASSTTSSPTASA